MPPLAPVRSHDHPGKFLSNLDYGGFGSVSIETLLELDEKQNLATLLFLRQQWHAGNRLETLRECDLLAVALANNLPFAFDAWARAGETVNGDTLFALFQGQRAMSNFSKARFEKFVRPHLAHPSMQCWQGAIFAHWARVGRTSLALDMMGREVQFDTPVPSPSVKRTSEDFLHTHDVKAWDNFWTCPLHLAIESGRWGLAEGLLAMGPDLSLADWTGFRALHRAQTPPKHFSDLDRQISATWAARLQAMEEATRLEGGTQAAAASASRRL